MTYEEPTRAELLASALRHVEREAKLAYDRKYKGAPVRLIWRWDQLSAKDKARAAELRAKYEEDRYDALRVPMFAVGPDGVEEIEVPK